MGKTKTPIDSIPTQPRPYTLIGAEDSLDKARAYVATALMLLAKHGFNTTRLSDALRDIASLRAYLDRAPALPWYIRRANLKTFHKSTIDGDKMWTLERGPSFGDSRYHVRAYYGSAVITDLPFRSEIAARKEFERKIEQHYPPVVLAPLRSTPTQNEPKKGKRTNG